MAKRLQIYKCAKCGNIVEVLDGGVGTLVCCGQSMQYLEPKTADATTEKHVPVIEKIDGGVKVKVGSVPHPMEEGHYIQWIEVIADGRTCRKYLEAGQQPGAVFAVEAEAITAREYCNVHGLWRG